MRGSIHRIIDVILCVRADKFIVTGGAELHRVASVALTKVAAISNRDNPLLSANFQEAFLPASETMLL